MKYLVNTVKMIAEQYPNLNLEIEKDTVRLRFDTKDNCENKILEITQRYSKLKNKDLNKLMRYAKKLNVDKKVREYMEVLL